MKVRKIVIALTAMLCCFSMSLGVGCSDYWDVTELVDFVVDVPKGRDPVVLLLSDTQFIDAAQQRTDDRLGGLTDRYSRANIEDRVLRYIREAITRSNPDLILIAGDIVYGEFDDSGYAMELFVQFMESFNIPWAPIMGNHECETEKGIDWICEQYESATNCLFKQRTLTGNGNYTVGIAQGGKLLRTFFMMDTNGYGHMSSATASNGHSSSTAGLGADQIAWYQQEMNNIKEASSTTKFSVVMHIPMKAFVDLMTDNGFTNTTNQPVDFDTDTTDDIFGIANEKISYPWDTSYTVFNDMKGLGVDSMFAAHAHGNSVGGEYEGVHLQFGLKTGTYDQVNYTTSTGGITFGYSDGGDPITGGTVIPVSQIDGSIAPYHLVTEIEEDQTFVEPLTPTTEDATVQTVHIQSVVAQADSNQNALYLQFMDENGQVQFTELANGVSSTDNTALENFAKQIYFNNEDVFAYKGVITSQQDAGKTNASVKFTLNQDATWQRSSYIYILEGTTYGADTDGNGNIDTVWTFDRDFRIVYDPADCVARASLGGCNGDCDVNEWHVYAKPIAGKESVAVSCSFWGSISGSGGVGMAFLSASGEPIINLGYTGWVNPDSDTEAFKKYIKINGNALPATARLQGFDQPNGLNLTGLSLAVGDVVTVEKGAVFTHNGYTMRVEATLSWTYAGGTMFTCSATA